MCYTKSPFTLQCYQTCTESVTAFPFSYIAFQFIFMFTIIILIYVTCFCKVFYIHLNTSVATLSTPLMSYSVQKRKSSTQYVRYLQANIKKENSFFEDVMDCNNIVLLSQFHHTYCLILLGRTMYSTEHVNMYNEAD